MSGAAWAGRLAALMVLGGIGAFALVLLRGATDDSPGGDRYAMLDVVSAPSLEQHAVVYRVDRPGQPAVTGVWLVAGPAPDRGDPSRPAGSAAAVWKLGVPRIGWQGQALRMVGAYADIRRGAAEPASCLDTPGAAWDLCLDPSRVTFVPLPR